MGEGRTEFVEGRGDVLHAPCVGLQKVGEVEPLTLLRLVLGLLVERSPLVDRAVPRATLQLGAVLGSPLDVLLMDGDSRFLFGI